MKKFIAFVFCMTVIPALILLGAAGVLYNKYFSPQPTEYEFLRSKEEIHAIEYVHVTIGSDGSINTSRVGFVDDVDGFVADLTAIDCYKGMPLESFQSLYDIKTLSGFVINYTDGSFEVITPYFCTNSDLKLEKPEDLLTADVYVFEKDAIQKMLIKYAPGPAELVRV